MVNMYSAIIYATAAPDNPMLSTYLADSAISVTASLTITQAMSFSRWMYINGDAQMRGEKKTDRKLLTLRILLILHNLIQKRVVRYARQQGCGNLYQNHHHKFQIHEESRFA